MTHLIGFHVVEQAFSDSGPWSGFRPLLGSNRTLRHNEKGCTILPFLRFKVSASKQLMAHATSTRDCFVLMILQSYADLASKE